MAIAMLAAIGLALIAGSGWRLARAKPVVNLAILVLTFFAAIMAHSAMQWAFLEGGLDVVLGDPRKDAPAWIVVPIAAGEAVGLWVPFLVLPWAGIMARVWAAVYALAAATLGAVAFYFPFDVDIIDELVAVSDGPPYLLGWFACLPVAGLGYLIGWLQSSREQADAGIDDIERLP